MKIVFSVLFLLVTSVTFAKEVTITKTWIPPTNNTDGSELSALEIGEFRFYHSIDAPLDLSGEYYSTKESQAVIVLELAPRPEPYTLRAAVFALDIWGGQSDPSNEVTQEFVVSSSTQPNPVSDPKITIKCGQGCIIEIAQ